MRMGWYTALSGRDIQCGSTMHSSSRGSVPAAGVLCGAFKGTVSCTHGGILCLYCGSVSYMVSCRGVEIPNVIHAHLAREPRKYFESRYAYFRTKSAAGASTVF
eukprot:m.122503 g.122503  ORF g.122503 m.122503 type:complete len:104 (+) comp17277_c0_seq5:652-963(+)